MSFRYILRYYIDPGFEVEKRIAELMDLCRKGKIEEVMFFYNPEELFQGYPDDGEVEKWFSLSKKLKKALDYAHILMSINPWTTTVHVSRGRRFTAVQRSFQPMVGENGVVSPITACPFDPHWQEYLCSFFARIAGEICPTAIWIEDDWRLHNHEPSMNYGGCFCPLHLARFEQETGIRTDRERLLENILSPGKTHPWRKAWMKVCRDSLLEPARKLYHAVHEANPSVRLALMSSAPDVHSIEGRDWNLFKETLSPDAPLLIRPHLPPYTEAYALNFSPAVCRQTISEYDDAVEIYPELENSPRCGKYSKSGTFNVFECIHSALCGSSGITINHYDMMGNGVALDYDFPDFLSGAKAFLDSIVELKLSDRDSEGLQVLYSPHIAENVRTGNSGSLNALRNNSIFWSDICFKLGISHAVTKNIREHGCYAVSGQTLRACSDNEIETLLSGNLVLDAPSVEILLERGFGSMIGIASAGWRTLDEDGYAYEEIVQGRESLYGVNAPRMTASRCSERILAMKPTPDAQRLTEICRYDRSILYPGAVFFRNGCGGKVLSIAYPLGEAQFDMGFFNNFRRIFLHDVISNRFQEKNVLLGCDVPLQAYRNRQGTQTLLALLNPTHDTCRGLRFFAPELDFSRAEYLCPDGLWRNLNLRRLEDGSMRYEGGLAPLNALVIRCPF